MTRPAPFNMVGCNSDESPPGCSQPQTTVLVGPLQAAGIRQAGQWGWQAPLPEHDGPPQPTLQHALLCGLLVFLHLASSKVCHMAMAPSLSTCCQMPCSRHWRAALHMSMAAGHLDTAAQGSVAQQLPAFRGTQLTQQWPWRRCWVPQCGAALLTSAGQWRVACAG